MKFTTTRPKWVGEAVSFFHDSYRKKTFYSAFTFRSIEGKVGGFVLVSNADAVDPDTPEGCDVAEIIKLYETADNEDPYRAVVRWYSRPQDVPKRSIRSLQLDSKVEIILDERPFDNDVSIETFFSNCVVVRAKVDDDPVIEAKKIEGHVCVPVFVCRYKLVGSGRSAKIQPYLDSDDSEVNRSNFTSTSQVPMIDSSSWDSVIKQNKYQPVSLKVDGTKKMGLETEKHAFLSNLDTQDNVLEATREKQRKQCNGNIQKSESDLSPVKRLDIHRSLKKDFDDLPTETGQMKYVKTKASEAMLGRTSYVLVKKLNLDADRLEFVEDGNRSSSPAIPLTEPSMIWYGIKDDKNHFTVLKIPIKSCDSGRKPLKSIGCESTQPSVKNVSLKEIGDRTSGSENETESVAELRRKLLSRYDEKKQMNDTEPGKSEKCRLSKEEEILETKNFTHKTKLKDKDISQLLDDENFNDEIFMPNKVTDKSKCDQNSQLKSSHQGIAEESESAVLHVKKTSEASTTDVETKEIQGRSVSSSFMFSDRMSRGGNIHKCESKANMNSIKLTSEISDFEKDKSDLTSTLASPSKIVRNNKQERRNSKIQRPEQSQKNVEDSTKLKSLKALPLKNSVRSGASALVSTPGCTSVVSEGHSDVKVGKLSKSQSCTNGSKDHHTSAKKKLSYEDSGTERKLASVESHNRCNFTDTSVALKDERTEGVEGVGNGRTELLTPKIGCASNGINDLEPIHKSHVIDYYLESMKNSETLNRHQNLLHKSEDYWVSVVEDKNEADAASCRSSLRLKLCRTNSHTDCDITQEIEVITPRRRKRQIVSDTDTDNDSDYEPGRTSRSKRYRAHEPHTPKSLKTDQKVSSCVRSSSRKCKPNKWYDSDWDTPTTTPKSSLRKKVTDGTPVTPRSLLRKQVIDGTPVTPKSSLREQAMDGTSVTPKILLRKQVLDGTPVTPKSSLREQAMDGTSVTPKILLRKQATYETPVTPKTRKSGVTPQAFTSPVSKRGSARRALLTPSVPTRASSVSTPGSVLEEARSRLHVAAVPKSLPCREKEFDNIYRFVEGKILDGAGGCMYISGVPGTGKTATVQEVVHSLQEAVSRRDIPDFQFIELNGMWLTEPRQAYVQLLNALTGQTVTAEQAQQILERRFSRTAHRRITTLLLVDELDLLWTRRQDVVYNLLDWPTKAASRLVVLTIANTMDLPERLLMGRVTSRLGLTRVTFHPYTHKQLQEIVTARLRGLQAFDPDAIQLVARKVAAVSGDARRALDICRRATELAEGDTEGSDSDGIVTMQHVDQALAEMIASTNVQAIRYCSKMEQLFLQAVAAEIQRTGVEETVFEKVYIQLRTLCIFDGYTVPSVTESLGLCARLGSCRLLLTEHSRTDMHQRVLLNVSSDDIHYALKV